MGQRPSLCVRICAIGLLICLALSGGVLVAMRRALQRATATTYTPLSGEAEWAGDWELSERGADPSEIGSQSGADQVTIPFIGTDFALRVRRGDYRGYFFVSVDGEPANQLPQEKRGAYLVLTSPDYAPQVVTIPVANNLEDGPHEAVIIAKRGWDQWPLVGWRVGRTPDTEIHRRALAALGALGLICAVGLVGWGIQVKRRKDEEAGTVATPPYPPFFVLHPPLSGLRSPLPVFIAAAVFYFSPWPSLTALGGLALVVLIFLRLDWGLALVVATAPLYLHPRSLFGKSFSMAEIAVFLCLLFWSIRQAHRFRSLISDPQPLILDPRSLSSLDYAVVFFVLVATASTLMADHQHVALRELRVVILEPALFYLMVRTSHLKPRDLWPLVDCFILSAVAVALIGLAQYTLGVNVITAEQGFRRLRSVYGSPNNAGLYLGRALPVLLAVALFGATRRRRIVYGLAVFPVGLAILLSFSKGALILGVPFSLLALGVLAGGRWLWASLAAVGATALTAIPLLRTPRFASLLNTRSGTTFFRLQLWRSSWKMFRDHVWFGVGPDNFLYQYRGRYILSAAWQEPDLSHPHNIFLDYGCRLGLFGLAAGLWLQIAFWCSALPLRRSTHPDRRALALGLMASMAGFLAHGLVDASYFVTDLAFVFFLTLGVVQWMATMEKRRKEQ